jgi:hypothetical protein
MSPSRENPSRSDGYGTHLDEARIGSRANPEGKSATAPAYLSLSSCVSCVAAGKFGFLNFKQPATSPPLFERIPRQRGEDNLAPGVLPGRPHAPAQAPYVSVRPHIVSGPLGRAIRNFRPPPILPLRREQHTRDVHAFRTLIRDQAWFASKRRNPRHFAHRGLASGT